MRYYMRALAATAVGLGLTLSGCSDSDSSSADRDAAEAPTDKGFNAADVDFAQQMIPHHRQAIEMAQLAESRAATAEVKALASDIEAAQGPEIETMSGWLSTWGEEIPDDTSNMGHMEHGNGGMNQMPGMMSDREMVQLEGSSGTEFDRMFLTMMIEHHQGAIEMSKSEQADGMNSNVIRLAEQVEADQTAEIETMRNLLQEL